MHVNGMSDSGAHPRVRRFHIELDKPLPNFDQGAAKAYAVINTPEYGDSAYVLLCPSTMPLRLELGLSLQNASINHFHNLIESDVVHGSGLPEEYMGLVLPKPQGKPIASDLNAQFTPWKEEEIRQCVIKPMIDVLVAFHDRAIAHGNISPLQMWRNGMAMPIKLAQCFTHFCGSQLPALFLRRLTAPLPSHGPKVKAGLKMIYLAWAPPSICWPMAAIRWPIYRPTN